MSTGKRQLDFRTAEQVIDEIERLQGHGYTKLKNWNLTQMCEHLSKTMEGGMNGLGFRYPWIFRRTLGKWVTLWLLKKRSMPSMPTMPMLKPVASATDEDPAVIAHCISTIQRAASFDGSLEDYPFLDGMTHEQWRQFMWMHAAHHLGFLVPHKPEG